MKFGSEIDFGDIFASGLLSLVLAVFVLFAALWLGVTIGEGALAAGDLAEDGKIDRDWLLHFFSDTRSAILTWCLPGTLGMAATLFKFGRLDGGGSIRWGIITSLISLLWVAAWVSKLDNSWQAATAAWGTCITLLAMSFTGLWFLRHWQMNRWAVEIAMLQAENAARRIELEEEFGTVSSAGSDEVLPGK
ncbi:hypothetical protein [Haloferula sp. BvORR071]|uniref:hypothetical protein n=1 Tax=Haloferula sp. BvORR071 TaxID=1396141 RepID=UPI000555CBE2|nr:hypothetical protein [Haloferula sp. BvORR071]